MSVDRKGGRPLPTGFSSAVLADRFKPGSFFQRTFEESANIADFRWKLAWPQESNSGRNHESTVRVRREKEIEANEVRARWGGDFKRATVKLSAAEVAYKSQQY